MIITYNGLEIGFKDRAACWYEQVIGVPLQMEVESYVEAYLEQGESDRDLHAVKKAILRGIKDVTKLCNCSIEEASEIDILEGVIVFDIPVKMENWGEYKHKYSGCISIVARPSYEERDRKVIARSVDSCYNENLIDLYNRKYKDQNYVLYRHRAHELTRANLTKGFVAKLAAEIKRAYIHLGVPEDYDDMRSAIHKKIKALWEDAGYMRQEEIITEDEILDGYSIQVGHGADETNDGVEIRDGVEWYRDNVQVLSLVVMTNRYDYVWKSFDAYSPRDISKGADEYITRFEKRVNLEDVDTAILHACTWT